MKYFSKYKLETALTNAARAGYFDGCKCWPEAYERAYELIQEVAPPNTLLIIKTPVNNVEFVNWANAKYVVSVRD